ncbi:Peptidyl-prolyl cis-trans isomerase B [Candidatus Sulfopaludibacter sp. SbA3]|nr:Peptidyl-prolyl cis-trans isomerase B [Candidatus Sulfopaludibacter sp. SbA3]
MLTAVLCAQEPQLPDGLYAVFATSEGDFTAKLYEKDTPLTVQNFVALAQGAKPWKNPKTHAMVRRPLYDNLTFHRVVSGEMIQAGSATGTTAFDCGVSVRDEFLPGLMFDRAGKLAMANSGSPGSGGCQFFITVSPMRSWDNKYAVFGLVVRGMDVVERINHAPVRDEKPLAPVKLASVTIMRIGPEPPVKRKR